jgi:flagellar motor switch protein FliN/FliY
MNDDSAQADPAPPVATDAPPAPPQPATDSPSAQGQTPIESLGKVELEAAVELGRVRLLLQQVLKLAPGAVLRLEKMVGDPVELRIKEELIARGQVVVIDDRLGLHIKEILSRQA